MTEPRGQRVASPGHVDGLVRVNMRDSLAARVPAARRAAGSLRTRPLTQLCWRSALSSSCDFQRDKKKISRIASSKRTKRKQLHTTTLSIIKADEKQSDAPLRAPKYASPDFPRARCGEDPLRRDGGCGASALYWFRPIPASSPPPALPPSSSLSSLSLPPPDLDRSSRSRRSSESRGTFTNPTTRTWTTTA